MAYRLKLDESVATGFIRIGLDQISRARHELEAATGPAVAVHEARKSLKRLRALLRLARPGLAEEVFRREDARFKDIAALLSGVRDGDILAETMGKLEPRGNRARTALTAARALIADRPNGAKSGLKPTHIDEAVSGLDEARKLFKKVEVGRDMFEMLAEGLEQSYRHGRRAFDRAYERPSDEAYHELRKGVQRHWRQMALLSRAWPDWTGARVAEARELSQILGDDHDLAVLAAAATDGLSAEHARVIQRLCRDRQSELRAVARPRACRLFAERPKRLRRKIELYWALAKEMSETEEPMRASRNGRARAVAII